MKARLWLALAGLSGAAGVAAEAAARHLLAGDPRRLELAATGGRYGLVHAAALLAVAALAGGARPGAARRWLAVSGWCFAAALLLFPGSLYLLAAGAPPGLAWLTPIGGTLFIAGWLALAAAALQKRPAG
jgi:uncharacterized membrane protein YgdD (TMEM256/DUF423 family)